MDVKTPTQDLCHAVAYTLDRLRPEPISFDTLCRQVETCSGISNRECISVLLGRMVGAKLAEQLPGERYRLTAHGIDAVEGTPGYPQDLVCVGPLEVARRDYLRQRLLQLLNAAWPLGCTSRLLHLALCNAFGATTAADLDREIEYLKLRQLIEHGPMVTLSKAGKAFMEGKGEEDADQAK